MSRKDLSKENQLMLLQGISLIENGFQFLEWMDDIANENSSDALMILRNRFRYYKECVFDEAECGYTLVDNIIRTIDNVQFGNRLNLEIHEQLKELRNIVSEEALRSKNS